MPLFDHGEVGGKLEDILGEALLCDGGLSSIGHLAESVGVAAGMVGTYIPLDLLEKNNQELVFGSLDIVPDMSRQTTQ